jgi:Putative zinc-finger
VPERHDHPDHERLAAFEAGDGDRRERSAVEAHLAGCPSCAEVVASVEQARTGLALLEEPELPPGLHDRLAAALEAETAQTTAAGPAPRSLRRPTLGAPDPESGRSRGRVVPGAPDPRAGRRVAPGAPARPIPWYRRPVAWGAAAALLLAALVVPLLDQSDRDLTTASGGAGDGAGTAAQEAGGADKVPVFSVSGEVSATAVKSRLATDRRVKAALDSAAAGEGTGAPTTPQSPAEDSDNALRSSAPAPRTATASADLQPCLPAAAAAADPATRPLVPAFYVEGAYQGRKATVLVTTSNGQPGRVDLWVFPRDNCSSPPLATERVR